MRPRPADSPQREREGTRGRQHHGGGDRRPTLARHGHPPPGGDDTRDATGEHDQHLDDGEPRRPRGSLASANGNHTGRGAAVPTRSQPAPNGSLTSDTSNCRLVVNRWEPSARATAMAAAPGAAAATTPSAAARDTRRTAPVCNPSRISAPVRAQATKTAVRQSAEPGPAAIDAPTLDTRSPPARRPPATRPRNAAAPAGDRRPTGDPPSPSSAAAWGRAASRRNTPTASACVSQRRRPTAAQPATVTTE